jgi:hypothetical protein
LRQVALQRSALGVAGLPQGVDEKAAEAGIAAWNKFRETMKK